MHHNENPIDVLNYKGIYFNSTDQKYFDPISGAHFQYHDLCDRLSLVARKRVEYNEEIKSATQLPINVISLISPYQPTKHIHINASKLESAKATMFSPKSKIQKPKQPITCEANKLNPKVRLDTVRKSLQIYFPQKSHKKIYINALNLKGGFNFKSMDLRKTDDLNLITTYRKSGFSPVSSKMGATIKMSDGFPSKNVAFHRRQRQSNGSLTYRNAEH